MKTILVPLDLSSNSKKLPDYAASFAKDLGAQLILLHVCKPVKTPAASILVTIDRYETHSSGKKLLDLCDYIKTKYKVKCIPVLAEGNITAEITRIALLKNVSMIIMGRTVAPVQKTTHGRITHVIKKAGCPVMAIPRGAVYNGLKRAVYATDYHNGDINCIKAFAKFISKTKTGIEVVHVCHAADFVPERMFFRNFTAEIKKRNLYPRLSFKLLTGKVQPALHTHVKKYSADLLVISADHKSWLEKIFGSRVTRKMVYHTKVPLIAWKTGSSFKRG